MLGLTYNLEISVRRVAVHHCLSCAGIATFVPNLDILYSQVAAAIIILNDRKQKEGDKRGRERKGNSSRVSRDHL